MDNKIGSITQFKSRIDTKTIENENPEPFDVDGCIIYHADISTIPDSERIKISDVVTGGTVTVGINRPMVRLLMESKSRGSYVMVWSRSGHRWATDVITALGIMDHVDIIMSKPKVYFDDTPVSDWLKDRVFIEPNVIYKQQTKET